MAPPRDPFEADCVMSVVPSSAARIVEAAFNAGAAGDGKGAAGSRASQPGRVVSRRGACRPPRPSPRPAGASPPWLALARLSRGGPGKAGGVAAVAGAAARRALLAEVAPQEHA